MDMNDVGRLLISVTRKVKKTASQIVHPLTQLEKWLKEATSNTNWGCSSTILNEIARCMTDYHDYVIIQRYICDCLNEKPSKWRKIYKTLILVEYLLKNGIERFVDDIKENMYRIRHLQDFYYSEEGKDKGTGIREKSKFIVSLLNDPFLLKTERKKAKDNRGKYIGINGKAGTITPISNDVKRTSNSCENNSFYKDRFSSFNQRFHSGINNCTSPSYDCNNEKELYDPYKPSSTSFNEVYNIDEKKKNVVSSRINLEDQVCLNNDIFDSKFRRGQTQGFPNDSTKTSIPVLPPPLSSSINKNRDNNNRIANSRRLTENLNTSTEPDKSILEAAQRLAKQEINNPFKFSNVKDNSTFSLPSSIVSDSIENERLESEWGTFIAANNQEENHHIFSQEKMSTNPFESNIMDNQTFDNDKKKKTNSIDLIDLLANNDQLNNIMENYQEKSHEKINDFRIQNDIYQTSICDDDQSYLHIPHGF